MLIPKLFLGLASTAGIGGLVSLSSIAGGGDDRNIWRVNSQTSFPLFTCSLSGSKISVSLKLKEGIGQLQDNKQVEFWGDGNAEGETINSVNLSSSATTNLKEYKLTIFKTSGRSKLEVKTDRGSSLSETLWCDTNVFKVTKETITSGISQAWENGFDQIKLTLSDCDGNGRRGCSIKIGDQVGLEWANDFKPKVII
ncbi:hypothetical protein WEN_01630 [Mycoplasma wenyonii str. Massachusetts]|uniref:Uncharacterized protein n=1 Tax=Mycoplasma wenyonii (strain Massachusetts) TaxID=1197325 RepID=I6YLE7_MYCWM|nr:hypothetical protein [Mycoplasma wenyonii]AFN65119.1 hypothetical protein WEN_01630 [Mycoplasma wenyonii str. Massachusetts]